MPCTICALWFSLNFSEGYSPSVVKRYMPRSVKECVVSWNLSTFLIAPDPCGFSCVISRWKCLKMKLFTGFLMETANVGVYLFWLKTLPRCIWCTVLSFVIANYSLLKRIPHFLHNPILSPGLDPVSTCFEARAYRQMVATCSIQSRCLESFESFSAALEYFWIT